MCVEEEMNRSEYSAMWRRNNPEKVRRARRKYWNSKKGKEWRKKWRMSHRPLLARSACKTRRKIRMETLAAYGNKCACCGESEEAFLAIDHINGGGNKHRKQVGASCGPSFYRWLKRNGWPSGFQLLCHNCNHAKAIRGMCPHQVCKSK